MIHTLRTAFTALIGALLLGGCWTSDEPLLTGTVARPLADGMYRYEKDSISLTRADDGYYDTVETRAGQSPMTAIVRFEAMPELDRDGRRGFAYQALGDESGLFSYGLVLVDATGFFQLDPRCEGEAADEAAVRIAVAQNAKLTKGDEDGECNFDSVVDLKTALTAYSRDAKFGTLWTRQP